MTTKWRPHTCRKRDLLHLKWIRFTVQIKYFKSKGVSNITPFKILNDMVYYTLLDPRNKILTVKWAVSI